MIDNPSSRYEAGLSSTIVNIRLRRDASLGVNGTAQAGVGFTPHDFASRGGFNLNYRTKKMNIFGNYGYNNVPFYSDLYQMRNYSGPRNIDIYSLKLDYEKPLSDNSNLETGLKTGQTVTDNEILYENLYDGIWVDDFNQSNRFKYTEQVSAAYATYNHRFGKFSTMAGLRAEYTAIKGESPTMDTTCVLQLRRKDKNFLKINFSRSI